MYKLNIFYGNFQNEATDCKYGILNIRAYYNTKSQTLVVDGKKICGTSID